MIRVESERVPDERYRGMNPSFVKRVWQKRREERVSQTGAERELRRAAKRAAREGADDQRTLIKAQMDVGYKQARQEERFRAEFLDNIAGLRFKYLVDKYKQAASSIEPMKVRYKAADILNHHINGSPYSYADFVGPSRTRDLVRYRQAAIADIYVLCPHLSLPQIGKIFGGRDHTTCLHAVVKLGVHNPKRHSSQAA